MAPALRSGVWLRCRGRWRRNNVLIEQDALSTSGASPAERLVADLPRDQALGLRLIALARAAAAVHMGTAWKSGIAGTQAEKLGCAVNLAERPSVRSGLVGGDA